jgi:hypothetical protein
MVLGPEAVVLGSIVLTLSGSAQGQVPFYDFVGDAGGDRFGASIAAAGDVNDDGFADFIVGAPQDAILFGNGLGLARVFSGVDGALLLSFAGTTAGQKFGYSVAGVGDVNGDDHDDVAVGTPDFDNFPGVGQGRVQVFSGADGALLYTFIGPASQARIGTTVAGVGDVDKDGVPDIAGGAPNSSIAGTGAGTVVVWSGANGSVLHTWHGASENAFLGVSLDGAGDFDGDDWADVIVGGVSGPVTLYSGKTGGVLMTYPAPAPEDQWGVSLACIGDFTGDGVPDFIIGAVQAGFFGAGTGYARVLNGASGATLVQFQGDAVLDVFGNSVDSAGDYDGDGIQDFIVGAPVSTDSSRLGYARIFSGANGQILQQFDAASGSSNLGAHVALLGDLNADGGPEVAVSQPEEDDPGPRNGSVQVYMGAPYVCPVPTNYCLSFPNTTGLAAQIGYTGTNGVAANDLVLTASDCPPAQFALFFLGQTQGVQFLGSGVLCVSGSILRLPPVILIEGSGTVAVPLDLNNLPANATIEVGDTRYFQLWFRDNGATNLTDGLTITFCP